MMFYNKACFKDQICIQKTKRKPKCLNLCSIAEFAYSIFILCPDDDLRFLSDISDSIISATLFG